MTLEELNHSVDYFYDGDPEAAHAEEDTLYQAVLDEVVKGNPDAQEMARKVLTIRDMNFERWYA